MKKISLMLLALVLSAPIWAQQASTKKNVLLIMVDDLNDWAQPFGGHPQAKTPNIKALAEKGVAFQVGSCASPVCNPSRTALLVGRRGHETGITDNADGSFRQSNLSWVKNLVTLPQYFSDNGYETVNQGKIFHTHNFDPISWDKVGPGGQGCNAGPNVTSVNNTVLTWSQSNSSLTSTGDYKSADWCANYINQAHTKPFFLACGIFRPHLPFHAPKAYYDMFPLSTIQLPAGYKANDLADVGSNMSSNIKSEVDKANKWKEVVQAYLANMAFADACVGHLLDKLAASAYANNTIVVLAGDHGWHLGEKEHFQKFTLWERAVRTTFVIYDPTMGVTGDCKKSVSLQDIYPTLLDLCSMPTPNFPVRGRSLKPLLQNPELATWNGASISTLRGNNHSLRSDQYRYIRMSSGDEELYDLVNDPWEFTNLKSQPAHAATLTKMKTAMDAMLANNDNPFGDNPSGGGGNTPPTVALTLASNTYVAPANIPIAATATDNGSVTKVEFYHGATLLGSDLTSPYTFTWTNVAAGSYTITAKATDNQNETKTSAPLTVTVTGISTSPNDITDLVAQVTTCPDVKLTWSDMNGETGYRIRRKLSTDAVYANIADIAANVTTYTDTTTQAGSTYVYMVRSLQNGVAAAFSNTPEILIEACATDPVPVDTFLKAFPNPTTGILTLPEVLANDQIKVISQLSGLTVLSKTIQQSGSTILDISSQPAGSYTIQVTRNNTLITRQIVKL